MILIADSLEISEFEDHKVVGLQMVVGARTLDLEIPLTIGQEFNITLRGRVVEIRFPENQNTGEIVRKHLVKIEGTSVSHE